MKETIIRADVFGFIKPLVDVHTMGMFTMANLLRDCGYKVYVAPDDVNQAAEDSQKLNNYGLVKKWIIDNHINILGFSYRLDPKEGCDYFMSLYEHLKGDRMLKENGGPLSGVSFAGLPDTCEMVSAKTDKHVLVFKGNETPVESLHMYGIPETLMPTSLINDNPYDRMRWEFAKKLIESERYKKEPSLDHLGYPECGKDNDTFIIPEDTDLVTKGILEQIQKDFGNNVPYTKKTIQNKLKSMKDHKKIDEKMYTKAMQTIQR